MRYSVDTGSNHEVVIYNVTETTTPSARGLQDVVDDYNPSTLAVAVMLSIFSVVGVVGNAIAFYIFFRRRTSSTSVVFILALAGTDFITCLVIIPFTIAFELLRYRLVYDLACKTYMFLITSTIPFSAYIMVGIALDRYFCICHPFLYLVTIPRAKVIIAGMGIPALTFGIMTAFMYGTYVYVEQPLENITKFDNSSAGPRTHAEIIEYLYNEIKPHLHIAAPDLTLDSIYIMSDKSSPDSRNASNYAIVRYLQHDKECLKNNIIFDADFVSVYGKVHAAGFVLAYVIVSILYILIYKSIYTRRANKAKLKKNNLYPLTVGTKIEETQMSVLNGTHNNGQASTALNNQQKLTSDNMGTRKIVLTARNDAGVLPTQPSKTLLGRDRNEANGSNEKIKADQDKDPSEKQDIFDKRGNNAFVNETTNNKSFDNDKGNNINLQQNSIPDKANDAHRYSRHLNSNGTSTPNITTSSTTRRDGDEKSEDDSGECSHSPLLKQDSTEYSKDNQTLSDSNRFLSASQTSPLASQNHPLTSNTTLNSTLPSTQDLSRSCPSLSHPSDNSNYNSNSSPNTTSVTGDANSKLQSPHISTSASVSPGVSPPTSLPIKITFNSSKPPDGSSNAKPKPKHLQTDAQTNSIKRKRQSTLRHRNLVANIKTAFMLFIVTLVFLIAFLPALLMTRGIIPRNLIFFYMYHIYNVANPFIYAFMNQTFREDLKKIMNLFFAR